MKLEIDLDFGPMESYLKFFQADAIPSATADSMTRVVKSVRKDWLDELKVKLRPNIRPFTRQIFIEDAEKAIRPIKARVFFRDEAFEGTPPSKYLRTLTTGGPRPFKRFESNLRIAGLLPGNRFMVPSEELGVSTKVLGLRGQITDRYGTIPGGMFQKILSNVKAQRDPQQNTTERSRARNAAVTARNGYFFYGGRDPRSKHLSPGIYFSRPRARSVLPILIETKQPQYKKTLLFERLGIERVRQDMSAEFLISLVKIQNRRDRGIPPGRNRRRSRR